jgi:hypothetical protein
MFYLFGDNLAIFSFKKDTLEVPILGIEKRRCLGESNLISIQAFF